jgi:cytoskeletal protein CcmA (bactofilin family)
VIFKQDSVQSELNGFLDTGSHIHGELQFEASFRVDGKVTGKITSPGSLIVGEGGEVDAEVRVANIFVIGVLRGTVLASKRLQIAPGGRVYADITTPSLVVEDGAILEGRCAMTREESGASAVAAADGETGPKLLIGSAVARD